MDFLIMVLVVTANNPIYSTQSARNVFSNPLWWNLKPPLNFISFLAGLRPWFWFESIPKPIPSSLKNYWQDDRDEVALFYIWESYYAHLCECLCARTIDAWRVKSWLLKRTVKSLLTCTIILLIMFIFVHKDMHALYALTWILQKYFITEYYYKQINKNSNHGYNWDYCIQNCTVRIGSNKAVCCSIL